MMYADRIRGTTYQQHSQKQSEPVAPPSQSLFPEGMAHIPPQGPYPLPSLLNNNHKSPFLPTSRLSPNGHIPMFMMPHHQRNIMFSPSAKSAFTAIDSSTTSPQSLLQQPPTPFRQSIHNLMPTYNRSDNKTTPGGLRQPSTKEFWLSEEFTALTRRVNELKSTSQHQLPQIESDEEMVSVSTAGSASISTTGSGLLSYPSPPSSLEAKQPLEGPPKRQQLSPSSVHSIASQFLSSMAMDLRNNETTSTGPFNSRAMASSGLNPQFFPLSAAALFPNHPAPPIIPPFRGLLPPPPVVSNSSSLYNFKHLSESVHFPPPHSTSSLLSPRNHGLVPPSLNMMLYPPNLTTNSPHKHHRSPTTKSSGLFRSAGQSQPSSLPQAPYLSLLGSRGPPTTCASNPNNSTGTSATSTTTKHSSQRRCQRCTCENCLNGRNSRHHHSRNSKDSSSVSDTATASSTPQHRKCHICHLCSRTYGKTSHLQAHIRWHNNERPFKCNFPMCTKAFTRSDELQRHIRTHSGIKNFVCEYCQKRFMRSDHLSKHKKTHEGIPGGPELGGVCEDVVRGEEPSADGSREGGDLQHDDEEEEDENVKVPSISNSSVTKASSRPRRSDRRLRQTRGPPSPRSQHGQQENSTYSGDTLEEDCFVWGDSDGASCSDPVLNSSGSSLSSTAISMSHPSTSAEMMEVLQPSQREQAEDDNNNSHPPIAESSDTESNSEIDVVGAV